MNSIVSRIPTLLLLSLFLWLCIHSAWLCDDSYISFRIIQNWENGDGITWNPGQRVQAFSHPLWFFCLYFANKIYGNLFLASMGLSILLSICSLGFITPKNRTPVLKSLVLLTPLGLLLFSKGFVDYTSSGLENPLSYFIFGLIYLHVNRRQPRFSTKLYLLMALAVLNRMDTLLLLLPLILYQLYHHPGQTIRKAIPGIMLLLSWFAFATFYFGFPLPNTYYAKLHSLYSLGDYITRGQEYYLAQLNYDPITLVVIAFGVILGQLHRSNLVKCLSLGIVLYLLYIARIGGDFMLGRFFALPAYASAFLIFCFFRDAQLRVSTVLTTLVSGVCVAYLQYPTVLVPLQDARVDYKPKGFLLHTITDERAAYYEVSGLLSPKRRWPQAQPSANPNPLPEVRCLGLGRTGLKADSRQVIIDYCALTDPFLARLPAIYDPDWDIGHVRRYIPEGYLDTVHYRDNHFADPEMAKLWNDIHLVSYGPLWSMARLKAIWRLQTFPYDIDVEKAQHGKDYLQKEDQIKRDKTIDD